MTEKRALSEEGLDPNAWMNTFCDLLLLMLTFFVLLLTMSSLDAQKIAEVARPGTLISPSQGSPVQDMIVLTRERMQTPELTSPHQAHFVARMPTSTADLKELQEELLAHLDLASRGWLERREETLHVHLDATTLFAPQSLELTPGAKAYIVDTARIFAKNERATLRIEVWQDGGSRLLDREAALDLALLRSDVLARAFMSQRVPERALQIGAYEGSAGVREERLLRQPELISLTMSLEPLSMP